MGLHTDRKYGARLPVTTWPAFTKMSVAKRPNANTPAGEDRETWLANRLSANRPVGRGRDRERERERD